MKIGVLQLGVIEIYVEAPFVVEVPDGLDDASLRSLVENIGPDDWEDDLPLFVDEHGYYWESSVYEVEAVIDPVTDDCEADLDLTCAKCDPHPYECRGPKAG